MKNREGKCLGNKERACNHGIFRTIKGFLACMVVVTVSFLLCPFLKVTVYAAEEIASSIDPSLFLAEQLNLLSNFRVTYQWGEKIAAIDGNFLPYWLVTDQNLASVKKQRVDPATGSGLFLIQGQESVLPENLYSVQGVICNEQGVPLLSEAAIFESMQHLFRNFQAESTGEIMQFIATDGRTIFFPVENVTSSVTSTNDIMEFQILKNAIVGHLSGEWRMLAAPGQTQKMQTAGSTYVEINLSEQKLYYYENGEQKLVTDIVTGNEKLNRETPQGCFRVYGKQTNRTLKGEGYKAFVHYWMPIYKNIGIHDASWRKSFGGTIYANAGSHGCINLPPQAAGQLYRMITVQTPVFVFK